MAFDSKEFAWKNITIIVGTTPITGIRGIEYTEAQEKEPYYAAGDEPQGIQPGNKSYKGSITLTQSAVNALEAASATGSILDIQVNIVINYAKTGKVHTDIVEYAEFTEVPKGMKQGDKMSEHTIPFVALGIQKAA